MRGSVCVTRLAHAGMIVSDLSHYDGTGQRPRPITIIDAFVLSLAANAVTGNGYALSGRVTFS